MRRTRFVNWLLFFGAFVISVTGCNAPDGIETDAISLKIKRPFVVTNAVVRAICVVSNGLHNAISFFEVGDDGFGYDIEKLEKRNGEWRGSGMAWCATGRKLKKLESGGMYNFEVFCKPAKEMQRVALEYWVGVPLESNPQAVFSEPFATMPVVCGGSGE